MERLLTLLLLAGLGSARGSALGSAPTCPCPQSRGQAVCGSDQVTYPSQCALQCASENKPDLALLHEGPCEAAAAVRVARALRGVSCATEAVNCQEKCGSYIRIYFRCSSDGKSECSCLPSTASCDDEQEKCQAKCSQGLTSFKCSALSGVAQQTTCICKSSPTPTRAECGPYARSCEQTCGSKATNILCHLDHDDIVSKSCTCGANPNSAHRTQVATTAALAGVLLCMRNWMTC